MVTSKNRGKDIYYDEAKEIWRYANNDKPVPEEHKTMPCGHCGRNYTKEGHDGCLGTLIGVMNACCWHVKPEDAYVQFFDGNSIHGEDARVILDILKKASSKSNPLSEVEQSRLYNTLRKAGFAIQP